MRPIKFRAWDKKEKKMYVVSKAWFDHDDELSAVGVVGKREMLIVPEDVILFQFTGLKDKNGKEIYQSDYLKQEGLEVEVKWSDFDAGFVFEDESGSHMSVTNGNSDQWEIIGNKYEGKNKD